MKKKRDRLIDSSGKSEGMSTKMGKVCVIGKKKSKKFYLAFGNERETNIVVFWSKRRKNDKKNDDWKRAMSSFVNLLARGWKRGECEPMVTCVK